MLIAHPQEPTDIVVVRHGQTDWNLKRKLQGWQPIPLNEAGRLQVQRSAEALSDYRPTSVFASPVHRVVQTAEILCAAMGVDPATIETHEGFGEFRMGDYEGLTWSELIKLESWHAYLDRPHETTFPGGESLVEIRARAVDAVNSIVAERGGGRLVIATHGGIARLIMLTALGAPLSAYHRLHVSNAGISKLRLEPGRPAKVLSVSWTPDPVSAKF